MLAYLVIVGSAAVVVMAFLVRAILGNARKDRTTKKKALWWRIALLLTVVIAIVVPASTAKYDFDGEMIAWWTVFYGLPSLVATWLIAGISKAIITVIHKIRHKKRTRLEQ